MNEIDPPYVYRNYFIGDGRNCAQYCMYTLMDCKTKSIVSTISVDKRETSLKSVNMEKVALRRRLEVLSGKLVVSELVNNAHVQIAAYIRGIGVRKTNRITCRPTYLCGVYILTLYCTV